jgi:hypothetical protein
MFQIKLWLRKSFWKFSHVTNFSLGTNASTTSSVLFGTRTKFKWTSIRSSCSKTNRKIYFWNRKKISISYLPSILSFQIRPSTYDFDYEKQYATFLSKQINEYHPFEQTSDYDSEYLPSEQVNIYIYILSFISKHLLTLKIPPNIYDFDYEKQYAEYISKQFDEFHPPEQTLDYQSTKLSLNQVNYFLNFYPNSFLFHLASSKHLWFWLWKTVCTISITTIWWISSSWRNIRSWSNEIFS